MQRRYRVHHEVQSIVGYLYCFRWFKMFAVISVKCISRPSSHDIFKTPCRHPKGLIISNAVSSHYDIRCHLFLQELLRIRDDVEEDLNDLKEKAQVALNNFAISEKALHDSGHLSPCFRVLAVWGQRWGCSAQCVQD